VRRPPGGGQVAVLRLHAVSTGRVTNAVYSNLSKQYVRQSTKGAPNFRELREGEVGRIHLPRTWVHKGMKKGRDS
jgi:hypothetical protein